jgi:polar amino acid transport system permease protein
MSEGATHMAAEPLTHPDVPLDPIVGRVAAARRRSALSGRVIFVATWLVLVLGLALFLTSANGFDFEFILEWAPFIIGGAGTTILLAVVSIVLATILALIGAVGRLSRNAVFFAAASLYVSLVRGTPLLVQIFFFYLALAEAGIVLPALVAGIAALSFNYGAYMTEIFRAGIEAVPRGQREAAEALGMPEHLVMRRIVLPQGVRIVIPAIGNEFIAMLKDTSLVSAIAVTELLWRAQSAGRRTINIFEALIVAALVYWVLTVIFSLFQARLERRMSRSDR